MLDIFSLPIAAIVVVGLIVAVSSLAIQLWRYGDAIKELTKIEGASKLFYLSGQIRDGIDAFGRAASAIEQAALKINDMTPKLDKNLSETASSRQEIANSIEKMNSLLNLVKPLAAAQRERVAQQLAEEDMNEAAASIKSAPRRSEFDPEVAFNSMRQAYFAFRDAFEVIVKGKTTIEWDARMIGDMAYNLTDGRRTRCIGVELADKIADLHGKFKAYTGRRVGLRDWLTKEIADEFTKQSHEATRELETAMR